MLRTPQTEIQLNDATHRQTRQKADDPCACFHYGQQFFECDNCQLAKLETCCGYTVCICGRTERFTFQHQSLPAE